MLNRVLIIIGLFVFILPVFSKNSWTETEKFSYDIQSDRLLEVILDVDVGEVTVTASDSVRKCMVRLTYLPEDYKAIADYSEKSNRLKIRLDKKGLSSRWDSDENGQIEAEVWLPKDVNMTLDTRVKAGEVLLDLGGLRLEKFNLGVWAGEVSVRFKEPNPIVMEYLNINAKVGELNTTRLGNARFKKARVNGGIGEIDVDFTGDLLEGALAKVDLDIGEARVVMPDDRSVRISIGGMFSFMSSKNIDSGFNKHGSHYYSDDFNENGQIFSVRITPGLGELTVDRE